MLIIPYHCFPQNWLLKLCLEVNIQLKVTSVLPEVL